jgi:hypothetical protein
MFKKIHLDFDFKLFLEADYSVHSSSCIKHQTHELTDIHDQYGGFPDSYNIHNTKIHQLWWTRDQLDFEELGQQLNMEVITVSSIKQPPGCVIPFHRDTFFQINQQYPTRTETKVRANIYLEDYKMGQFLQYKLDNQFETSTNWKSGDGFLWNSNVLHVSSNAGFEDKYTLQVSGFCLTTI